MLLLQPVLAALCPLQMYRELMTKRFSNEIQYEHLETG